MILPALSLSIFAVPKQYKSAVSLLLSGAGIAVASIFAISGFVSEAYRDEFSLGFLNPVFYLDSLSSLFIVLLNIVFLTAVWYSAGYLKSAEKTKSGMELSLHLIAYIFLYCAILGVILFRDTMTFLFFWEMMTGATFVLVIFEGAKTEKLRTAINYLVQMHVCLFILLIAFSIAERNSEASGFDAVAEYFASNSNLLLFILFLLGFGIKAGFVPLHSWLPEVHPSASGNVSGFMSGAVIKTGIYGLMRIISSLSGDLFSIALILLAISAITGIYGISGAIRQKDIKRLLAFSSIDNIGIIGLGLGVGLMGQHWQLPALTVAGYSGALLHTFNHSMFKTLLFFSAGTLCKSARTQMMDKMGGAIRRLPRTAIAFLVGSLAICALPPLNGFISEFILYSGLFAHINEVEPVKAMLLIITTLVLALIGGMSIFAFTKAFGISFLGTCRNSEHECAPEQKQLVLPLTVPLAGIILVALFPTEALYTVTNIAINTFDIATLMIFAPHHYGILMNSLAGVSLLTFIFVLLSLALFFLRRQILSKRSVTSSPVWGCGYTAPSAKLQYTASSFSGNFEQIASSKTNDKFNAIADAELFPQNRKEIHKPPKQFDIVNTVSEKLSKLAVFQTGKIQHYVLFALLFMLIILIMSYII